MLTRFFGQSKPINFIFLSSYMLVFYVLANFNALFVDSNSGKFTRLFLIGLIYILGMVLINFIAKKNDLSKMNTFVVLSYTCFTTLFFSILRNPDVILSAIFAILAMRRIVSLRTNKDIEKKIFDAGLWIAIASLFQFWPILLFIVLYFAILMYSNRSWKNFAIPLVSVVIVFVISTAYSLAFEERWFSFSNWFQKSSFHLYDIQDLTNSAPLAIVILYTVGISLYYFLKTRKASISKKPGMYLMLITLIVCLSIALFSPTKDGSELMYLFLPLSIMSGKYFERKKHKRLREVLLICMILFPIILPFLA